MKKLKLDDLEVSSFETVEKPDASKGTVAGHGVTETAPCSIPPHCLTPLHSCDPTCGPYESCQIFC